jgi:Fe-S oxidoreductase
MFPHDEDAKRLSNNTLTLAEFLQSEDYEPPRLDREAIVHRHCHQYAVIGFEAEQELYERMGLDYEVLDSGCCGLAGSWGFEEDKYELSMKIGERRLLPSVRDAGEDAIIMADGFSCKTQVSHGTDRRPLHTAQVIKMALDQDHEVPPRGERPEARYPDVVPAGGSPDLKTAALAGAIAAAALALVWASRRRPG